MCLDCCQRVNSLCCNSQKERKMREQVTEYIRLILPLDKPMKYQYLLE